jgi:arylsulfatase
MLSRRHFLAASAAVSLRPAAAAPVSRPHILLLMTDQHRADCIGAAGNPVVHTPAIDRLAAGGVLFRHAYSSTPTCTPARAALLTGQSPWTHGMLGYGAVAEKYPVEMPRLLRDAGYYTTGIGKMHWTPQRALHGFHQTILDESGRVESVDFRSDYRSWFWSEMPSGDPDATGLDWNGYTARPYAPPERLHPTAWIGETAVRWIRGYRRPEPFFLKVSFERPHSPYDPPQRWWDRYADADLPPARAGQWAEGFRAPSGNQVSLWHGDLGAAAVRTARRGYYGSVSFIDEQIGRILETLDERRLLDDTLILLLADHGDMLGDHHLWRKSYAYEASAGIPMIVRPPRGMAAETRGRVLPHPAEIRDVLPTLLDAAGLPVPEAVEGRSLLGPMRNPQAPWRQWIDLEHDVCYSPANHWTALSDGRRKFIFHAQTGREQFFDLEADPHELRDLAQDAARASEVSLWRGRMVAHLAVRGEPWVQAGRLGVRPASQLYSPHYPG